jgi:glycosyltransferase involved in cell wall biosynthesis
MKISVIIPVYNEVATCIELINRVQAVPIEKEIIVVDDGSTDGSTDKLAALDNITLLKHEVNCGKGAAVQTAVEHIAGELVILQDGDLEYDPADYQKLIKPITTGQADVVFGSRWLGKHNAWSLHYWAISLSPFFPILLTSAVSMIWHPVTRQSQPIFSAVSN